MLLMVKEEESMYRRMKVPLRMDNLVLCSGCGKMDVSGISIHVPLQLVVGISPSSHG